MVFKLEKCETRLDAPRSFQRAEQEEHRNPVFPDCGAKVYAFLGDSKKLSDCLEMMYLTDIQVVLISFVLCFDCLFYNVITPSHTICLIVENCHI